MGTAEILITAGVVAVLASIAGGGLKGFGIEVPLLASVRRQVALLIVGAGLLGLGLYMSGLKSSESGKTAAASVQANAAEPTNAAAAVPPAAGPSASATATQPEVPNIVGLSFPSARDFLIQNSWAPVNQGSPMANDNLGFRVQEIFDTGFLEAVSCSSTSMGFCLFRYKNPHGFVLEVVTAGEDLKTARIHGTKLLDCSERPRPEGC